MKSKILVAIVLGAAAILLVVALALDFGGSTPTAGLSADTAQSPVTASPSASAAPSAHSSASPSAKGKDSEPKKQKTEENKPGEPTAEATRPSWDPKPSASPTRLEVPEQPKASQFKLPDTPERQPVLKKAPKTGMSTGKLTKEFPKDAVPVPKATTIVQSSVEKQEKMVFAGVEGRSNSSVEEVLSFYSEHFEQQQWLTTQSEPATGVTQLMGSFGADSTTVTIRQLPTGATSIVAAGVFEIQE
ncbi:hypothetical protein [Glutamicibacter ardleyensis]|uniref:Uncharacterized protein n=1 Tax=Glutamicibacter ardleyensis TaxID=225894 RepID=A0ABQ2DS30_9MICC|nr:hypothetical protein [Glutamicibacter ardleyensis]GGJ70755.1 hypothetical protein GCM10007173_31980 [Glutamicibacter ardleyensis]